MTHIDLFSGIGGFALAAQWAGYETVLFCDNDPYCQAVLRKHWPDVPIIGDIRDVNETTVANAASIRGWCEGRDAIHEGRTTGEGGREGVSQDSEGRTRVAVADHQSANPHGRAATTNFPTVDLLTGGFPCQPFSVAGKRGGTSDDRYLWPEMLRVISEVMPTWVLAENVGGLVSLDNGLVFERVLSDLEGEGYEVQPLVIPACAVNAPHRRDRVWIVAHVDDSEGGGRGLRHTKNVRQAAGDVHAPCDTSAVCSREDVADTDGQGWEGRGVLPECGSEWATRQGGLGNAAVAGLPDWAGGEMGQPSTLTQFERPSGREVECDFCGIPHGVSRRVDRLRCLGNAIVPQVAYEIIKRMQVK